MQKFWYDTIYIAMVVLLPLVPAILLYRVIPSKKKDAQLTGPLKGFKLKLSGAVAAYFAVVLLVAWFYPPPEFEPENVQIYRLRGQLALPDTAGLNWKTLEDRIDFP